MKNGIKTLFLTQWIPYPPIGGAPLRNWQNINIFTTLGSVAVFSISNSNPSGSEENFPGISLWQDCDRSGAISSRTLIQKVLWWLTPNRHPLVDLYYQAENCEKLETFLLKFQPDLIIVEELWLYPYLSAIQKTVTCPIVLDQHNIEANLLTQNQTHSRSLANRLRNAIQNRKLKFIENDFIHKASQVWVCSQADAELLAKMYGPCNHVKIVPNGIDKRFYASLYEKKYSPLPAIADNPHTIFFAGTFSYPPNQGAARMLIDHILPKLQQRYANARLLLVGKSPTAEMLAASHQNKAIVVTGRVDDIRDYMAAASVAVVPLSHGGGTRLKVLEAFAAGIPVVTTTKGIEGIDAKDDDHVLIRDSVEGIVEAIDSLWSDKGRAEMLTEAAIALLQQKFSREVIGKQIKDHVDHLI